MSNNNLARSTSPVNDICYNRDLPSNIQDGRPAAPPPFFHDRSWGAWTLDTERLCLVCHAAPYEVDLEGIQQSSQLLDRIFQIRTHSRWATARVMSDLLRALNDIFRPQAHLCSHGVNKIIPDPKAFLEQRMATVGKDGPPRDAA